MTSWLLPDVNVWVALNYGRHTHHASAKHWYETQPASARLVFCRQTQLGLFRVLTTAAVMDEKVLSLESCWQLYDRWISTGQLVWADEPRELEATLRSKTALSTASPKTWTDAYLAAFAEAAHLTLITFDKALAKKIEGAVLLA
jgi:toxin-antitoxin system PIN domain toxin